MSKHITAGDTLTVGDLTDDHLGAVIEVGPIEGVTYRLRVDGLKHDGSQMVTMLTAERGVKCACRGRAVTVITPPPVVQPDEPTIPGQCIRIEGLEDWWAVVTRPEKDEPFLSVVGSRWSWTGVLGIAGDRRIIVSDPPRWPDEAPAVPERIEVGEWPDDDTHLRAWEWVDADGDAWRWGKENGVRGRIGWSWSNYGPRAHRPIYGPWTRGERVE